MTDYDEVPTAVRSMKLCAEEYIPKKLIKNNLLPLLKALRKRVERHDMPIHERQSAAFRETYRKIGLAAPTNMSVLIWVKAARTRNTLPGKCTQGVNG